METKKVYFKDLTTKEMQHLKEVAGITTLEAFKRTAEKQNAHRNKNNEPCYECKSIAIRLGLPV